MDDNPVGPWITFRWSLGWYSAGPRNDTPLALGMTLRWYLG